MRKNTIRAGTLSSIEIIAIPLLVIFIGKRPFNFTWTYLIWTFVLCVKRQADQCILEILQTKRKNRSKKWSSQRCQPQQVHHNISNGNRQTNQSVNTRNDE